MTVAVKKRLNEDHIEKDSFQISYERPSAIH